jgi:hypothetical protein
MSDSPEQVTARQARFLYRNGALTEQFETLRESERRQVVRAVAIAQLKENNAGLPLRNLDDLGYQAALDMAGALSVEPPSDEVEAMREAGIPLRESAGKPAHELAADLLDAIPNDHEDSEPIKVLCAAGAALSTQQREQVAALARKHASLLEMKSGAGDDAVKESMRALHEAGVPTRGDFGFRPEAEPRELTPLAALREAGVNLKGVD